MAKGGRRPGGGSTRGQRGDGDQVGDPVDGEGGTRTRWGIHSTAKGGRRPGGGSTRRQRADGDQLVDGKGRTETSWGIQSMAKGGRGKPPRAGGLAGETEILH